MSTDTLNDIAKRFGTDKSSEIHNYCTTYEKYFPFKRSDEITIMEIGVLNGESLNMWKEYYDQSTVIGIDIDPLCKKYESDKIKIEIGSQNDADFLKIVTDKYISFDLIVDDGSHISLDVIYSFNQLFNSLKSGGVYVVEDSCTSYWEGYGGGYKNPHSSIEYFKGLIDDVNYRGLVNYNFHNVNARREDVLIDLYRETHTDSITSIESINFINSLIIITKK